MDLHYIVDKLNDAPFQYGLSLLSISEKSSQELLQLLSDVFAKISPKHQHINVSKEDPDQTADRLIKFLKIVKYKPPSSVDPAMFRAYLGSGDRDTIFTILKWVVPQPQELQKRAFVGHYLSFPDMPEEFNYDADIMELKEEIKNLQGQFIETHRASEAVKGLNKDTAQMKKRIKSLEEEKERLTDKVAKAKGQVDKIADRASYMDVCSALRKQQDEEVNLSTSLLEQKKKLEKAEATHVKASTRLRDLQASYQEGSAAKLLEAVVEDVNNNRAMVGERYPKELEKRQKRVQVLQEALGGAVNTEVDLQRLQHQANALHSQIAEIQERRTQADKQRQGDKKFMQLRQAQQMGTMATRKKSDLNAKLERLLEKKTLLTAQFEKLTASDGSVAVVSEEEWRSKYESMKAALPSYKKMKKELGDIEAEVFVLAYTEELLADQEGSLNKNLAATARKQGVAGFADVANDLEKVSEQKSVADEAKGMTLQEISRTVEEINNSIADRKVRLAPQIKKLRMVRQAFAELEAEHAQSKVSYDTAMAQFEQRVGSVQTEAEALKTEVLDNETKFHLLNCQLNITDHNIKRVSSGPTAERLKDKYQARVHEAEDQAKHMKDRQKDIKDTHSNGLSQIDMMNDLIKLLQLKLDLQRREMGIAPSAPASVPIMNPIGMGGHMGGGGGGGGGGMGGPKPMASRPVGGLAPLGNAPAAPPGGGKEFTAASGANVFVL
ncbi:hypothetical protein FOA52_013202 [Chlamydomonas sp. UWO 241]|nr:hypothetical protein FOA52_013202 [Chlamydomonas sp. UWO 241]